MSRASTLTLTIRVSFEVIYPFSAASALLLQLEEAPECTLSERRLRFSSV
jgi:hypothetical protein